VHSRTIQLTGAAQIHILSCNNNKTGLRLQAHGGGGRGVFWKCLFAWIHRSSNRPVRQPCQLVRSDPMLPKATKPLDVSTNGMAWQVGANPPNPYWIGVGPDMHYVQPSGWQVPIMPVHLVLSLPSLRHMLQIFAGRKSPLVRLKKQGKLSGYPETESMLPAWGTRLLEVVSPARPSTCCWHACGLTDRSAKASV
jgi:hypothetical protein